jgi:Flp pilus assembly secretin CpaC
MARLTYAHVRMACVGGFMALGMGLASQVCALSQVTVEKDQSLRVTLKGAAGNIIVTNPRIADVTVVDSHTLYIIGRGVGTSGVTITDTSGRTLWEASVLVNLTRANAVTVYRGTKPTVNVCVDNTCAEIDARAADNNR